MNELVPIKKSYEVQDHGLNLFLYNDNKDYTFLFDDTDIDINECTGRLVYIPYSLMLVDAFYNGVLTPMEMMFPVTDNDADSMLAWTIVNAVSDRQKKPIGMTTPMSITLNCILCSVAREKVVSIDQETIDKIDQEKEEFFKTLFKGGNPGEVDLSGRDSVMILVAEYVDQFFSECLDPLYYQDVSGLINTIYGYYKRFAEATAQKVNLINFHPEVLERL